VAGFKSRTAVLEADAVTTEPRPMVEAELEVMSQKVMEEKLFLI
jgi:hypothetical protein